MSYHVVVHAMEARAGIAPLARFWMALRHAQDGHLPYQRYHQAGLRRAARGCTVSQVEASVRDWIGTDLNPAVQAIRLATSYEAVVQGFNAYNQASSKAVNTQVEWKKGAAGFNYVARRKLLQTEVDPEPCRMGTLAMVQWLFADVGRRQAAEGLSVGEVAQRLAVQSTASAQAAEVFERRGNITIPELARELGCGQRTLERRLKQEGGSAEVLRASTRLVAATRALTSSMSLTEIAFETGFSDSAHMSRAFKAACGMSPSVLRRTVSAPPEAARSDH